ncbi:MAG: inactive transglutaminase family protein [Gammaproteobacteria bacterium]
MQQRHNVTILAAILIAVGLAVFWFKASTVGLPLTANVESDIWTVEARISFVGDGGPVKANMRIPNNPTGFGILKENFVSRGYGLSTLEEQGNREAQWARRSSSGPQALYYRVSVYKDSSVRGNNIDVEAPSMPILEEPYATALVDLVAVVRSRSADTATFTAELLRRLNRADSDESVALFLEEGASTLDTARVAQTILAGARIPSRIGQGIELRMEPHFAAVSPWLEVYSGTRWLHFNPMTGEAFEPENRLTWYYGASPLLLIDGDRINNIDTEIFVRRDVVDALEVAEQRASSMGSHAIQFSLFSLPIRTQAVYAVLLMIPIGALVMAVMRNVIGMLTFGTSTPILVALAFRETRLLYGVILFSLVVALGLTARFYLEKLRLLLVPRLAAVLTVVVMLMLSISIFGHKLDLETGLSIALFPMVILTMVIERMSIVWDERGPSAALKEGLGSLLVAMAAYMVMSIDQLEHLMFVFPELLLIVLGVCLLLGRYTGYRLTELVRFSELANKPSSQDNS